MYCASKKLSHWIRNQKKIDGITLTKPENIYWISGFQGSFGIYLQNKNEDKVLITDGRYSEKAEKICKQNNYQFQKYDKNFTENFGKTITGKFLIEDSISVAQYKNFKKQFPNTKLKAKNFINTLRQQKNEAEIMLITKAQNQIDKILVPFAKSVLKEGITEREVAFRLIQAICDFGKYEISFND